MTLRPPPLDLRMRRSWRTLVTIAVPAFAVLIVVALAAILSAGRGPLGGILGVTFLAAVLGGLIVVPGTVILTRLARGAPDVRIDGHSTMTTDQPWDEIRATIEAHLGRPVEDG